MIYADFSYYKDVYMGVLTIDSYTRLAAKASRYLDQITFDRASSYTDNDKVKTACCALADAYNRIEKLEEKVLNVGQEISSETVGKVSVSYRSSAEFKHSAGLDLSPAQMLKDTAVGVLWSTGLLYRGV